MKKNIIIVLAISVPVLLGLYLYKKRSKKSGLNTGVRRTRTGNNNGNNTASDNARQQIYNLQQGQILRDKFIADGILKESDLPN